MFRECLTPESLPMADDILQMFSNRARIIAGGTDLIPQFREGKKNVDYLVDITQIIELKNIQYKGGFLYIGSAVTHAEIAASPEVHKYGPLLGYACNMIGSPQIRNVGTIGGNIVNAQPAADSAVALTALDAEVMVYENNKYYSIVDQYADICVSSIDSRSQILTDIRFKPLTTNAGCSFQRFSMRKGFVLPAVNVAVVVFLDETGCYIKEAKIVVAPVAANPERVTSTEEYLEGSDLSENTFKQASIITSEQVRFRDSVLRGSSDYRQRIVKTLVNRALIDAVKNAKAKMGKGE